jgi:hypothetical protein
MKLIVTSQFYFVFPIVEVSQELNFSFQSNNEGMMVTSVVV